MNKKNTEYLLKKYPNLYKQYYWSKTETCMCWGFTCDDGWFKIIDELSQKLVALDPTLEATQVKEKFGGLRVYLNKYSDEAYKLVEEAEIESSKTCENCGSKEEVTKTKSLWIKTLCSDCRRKYYENSNR